MFVFVVSVRNSAAIVRVGHFTLMGGLLPSEFIEDIAKNIIHLS
jgi:hypothetical protein